MSDRVIAHYTNSGNLIEAIRAGLQGAGKDLATIKTSDLATIDEFHVRGRQATLELAEQMGLRKDSRVLDIGSGLGGPARTLAEVYGCNVTGVDLTQSYCITANTLSEWVGLSRLVGCRQGDATSLPFADNEFDAAITIHVAMNIPAKDRVYAEAHRVLKPGGIFTVYDILQGDGGEVLFPVPWAREPNISFLATPDEMMNLLANAGFEILKTHDSTEAGHQWFAEAVNHLKTAERPPVSPRIFLGDDFIAMAQNLTANLKERRALTVSYLCRA